MSAALRLAGDVHQPAHALNEKIIARARGVWPILPEARDGAIDDARIDRFQRSVIEPVFFETADFEVFDDHVGVRGEFPHARAAFVGFEVSRHAALAAIARMKIGRAEMFAVLAFDEGRTPLAGVVARAFALHLHDIRAEIGEQLPAPRPRKNARKFKNANACEGACAIRKTPAGPFARARG